uniref:ATP synthase F(0) complex subunit C1, mitochondrial-like n=1 Tax=Lonchura striata TaxID=40157 RepID=UPI0012931C7D|nr:ATP synthase F(0) complex subunit C1, mitochondrial-like [Lonchura striata domestica]
MPAPVALLSSPALLRCCSRALARPVSVAVLSRPEESAQLGPRCWDPLLGPTAGTHCWDPTAGTPLLGTQIPIPDFPGPFPAPFPIPWPVPVPIPGFPGRNPSLKQQLFSYAILGFALSEAMGLFCLMVAFLILFAM